MSSIYRTVVHVLGVFIIAMGPTCAIAQADIPVTAYKFRSPQGCSLQLLTQFSPTSPPEPFRLLTIEPGGACRAGQAQGIWIFGTGPEVPTSYKVNSVLAAAFDSGSTKWMQIVFVPHQMHILQLDVFGKWWIDMKSERVSRNDSVQTLQTRFDDIADRSAVPLAERAALLATAQRWLSDPDKFVERYTADTGLALVPPEKIFLVDPFREATDRKRREQEAALQAEEQRRASAAAREQQEFRASLARMNPGQLFNRADALQAAGEGARATEVRRTLIERFPNHALAATAAQQLAAPLQAGATAAAAAAAAAAPAQASPTRVAASPGRTCVPDPGLLQRYMDAQAAFARQTSGTMRPISQEEAMQRFTDFRQRFVASRDVRSLRDAVAERRRQASNLNESNVVSRVSAAETRLFLQIEECELNSRESQAASPGSPTAATQAAISSSVGSRNASSGCASTPQESFRRFDKEMGDFASNNPNSPPTSSSGSGARDQNQYAFFFGTQGLIRLETYRNCLSASDYEANKRTLEGMRDNGKSGCERLSTVPGSCTATYPAAWTRR